MSTAISLLINLKLTVEKWVRIIVVVIYFVHEASGVAAKLLSMFRPSKSQLIQRINHFQKGKEKRIPAKTTGPRASQCSTAN